MRDEAISAVVHAQSVVDLEPQMSTVLVLNAGSSSLKYQLLDPTTSDVLAVGIVEKIGQDNATIKHDCGDDETKREQRIADHAEALRLVMGLFDEVGPSLDEAGVIAVGHRVVHGGTRYCEPTLITDEVIEGIRDLIPLAPLHNPANITGIEAAREIFDVPHIAVFDTAFFTALPAAASTYAINADVARDLKVRRYGFHGTSHQYVSSQVSQILGRDDLRQVILHLGNGASASAVVAGKAVDTSMGLTPLEGLMMGTRSGDVDPALIFHLLRVGGLSVDDVDNLLNKASGMVGMTGKSDMREVHALIESGDERAKNALDVYCLRLIKYVGAYAAEMGGIDVLTFTAGIGENDDIVRRNVVERLGSLGLAIDEAKNSPRSKVWRSITPDGHEGPAVLVVPTNEELAIARQAVAVVADARVAALNVSSGTTAALVNDLEAAAAAARREAVTA
jgi:acetate kinase